MTSTETPTGDPIEGLVGFTVVLRAAGLAVTTDRVAAIIQSGLEMLIADPEVEGLNDTVCYFILKSIWGKCSQFGENVLLKLYRYPCRTVL